MLLPGDLSAECPRNGILIFHWKGRKEKMRTEKKFKGNCKGVLFFVSNCHGFVKITLNFDFHSKNLSRVMYRGKQKYSERKVKERPRKQLGLFYCTLTFVLN